ncbi:hypothetical protein GE107_02610 [Cohnella sp. CFH 77786]|uniref:ComEA family DNA-binding protein n=1 Tax=Cohnella sp. CFH 77786 TaxID=2662265 RepID=UPI001C608861|nr:helix-hairpin-helix domain-containing protein [Cohnella sp. CFH 77786]MBW5444957.1 hypothetical protein [Cohnella sp. CFH 77786]
MAYFFPGQPRKTSAGIFGWLVASAGAAVLLYLLLAPEDRGIPGWQPVNGSLQATLAAESGQAESTAPTAASSPGLAAPAPSAPAGGPAATPAEPVPSAGSTAAPSAAAAESSGREPVSAPVAKPAAGLLDLNAATESELDGLPGIGPSKAKAIAAYRDARSGFRSVDELLQVKGIGTKLLERIRPLVTVAQSPP